MFIIKYYNISLNNYCTYIPLTFFQVFTIKDAALNPLNREIRYTKFSLKVLNQSIGEVLDNSIKQYGSKQTLFFHFNAKKEIAEFNVNK